MNQTLAGAAALLISIALWGFGRKPRLSSHSFSAQESPTSKTFFASSPKKIDQQKNIQDFTEFNPIFTLKKQISPKKRLDLQHLLRILMRSGPEERLEAIQIANKWGDPIVIPILKKALRDSDSNVVAAAASAINKFKGKTYTSKFAQVKDRPPRNVSLMR